MSTAEITAERSTRPHFTIVDETDDYAVVDKPPFLLMHPTKPDGARTLWSELRALFAFEIANGGQVSLINRLDRETSGLVLVAKNAQSARRFGLLMQRQQIAKEYVAIVSGWPDWSHRVIDAPLARQGALGPTEIWLKQTIHPRGAPAVTEFLVERRVAAKANPADRFAIVRALPRTGRTHQVRVHLASTGHPIIGDKIYGPDQRLYLKFIEHGWSDELRNRLLLPRHALHAARLAIAHESWRSPLPADLQEWLDAAAS